MSNIIHAFVSSPNTSSRNGQDVGGIILHYTRGGNASGTLKWFQMKQAKVSAHYVISRSGKIYQMVHESRAAWHAGSGTSVPKLNDREHLNGWTIGIEICNWGPLYKPKSDEKVTLSNGSTFTREANKVYCAARRWTTEYRGATPDIHNKSTPVIMKDKYWPGSEHIYLWEPYPEEQYMSVHSLLLDILDRHPHIEREWIARHQDVDPTRKLDTGPAFPFSELLDDIFGEPEEPEDEGILIGRDETDTVTVDEMEEMTDPRHDGKCKWSFWKK